MPVVCAVHLYVRLGRSSEILPGSDGRMLKWTLKDERLMLQLWPRGAVQHERIACKSRCFVGMQFRLFDSRGGWVRDARERLLGGV